jgi:hypothetical protein
LTILESETKALITIFKIMLDRAPKSKAHLRLSITRFFTVTKLLNNSPVVTFGTAMGLAIRLLTLLAMMHHMEAVGLP